MQEWSEEGGRPVQLWCILHASADCTLFVFPLSCFPFCHLLYNSVIYPIVYICQTFFILNLPIYSTTTNSLILQDLFIFIIPSRYLQSSPSKAECIAPSWNPGIHSCFFVYFQQYSSEAEEKQQPNNGTSFSTLRELIGC